ncbi:PREDICTED: protein FAM166B isoform X2 [Mandrillus leucophaeus]|uniref:protein FAM166B isoform X2 n=1 Tax=Mandrillus leucophaeus TaxID=9568 RepID=UPI0005F3CD52|nr:PREDICTED: protein FAM166B isoform X2 [Mandrillus leucophaeus]
MAVASTFIPGLNPQNAHYIPGMGQTYGQVTGQLLRDPPGLAWPPVHRTLLPPIRPPRSPEVPRESLPLRHGHKRLSSSMIPGYTGFVPRAQFIFAKNCSQVWAEALSDFTHLHGKQGSEELPKEAKGRKDTQKDQVPEPEGQLEEQPALEVVEQASSYSMDDRDPRKFTSAFLCSATRHCRNLGRSTHQAVPRRTPNISPHFPGHTLRTWVFYLTMGAMCQGISSSLATHLAISPMMLWASAPSRSSSWLRPLDIKFPSLFILSQPSFWKGERWVGGA